MADVTNERETHLTAKTPGQDAAIEEEQVSLTFANFLEQTPPDIYVRITDFRAASSSQINPPDITLYCSVCEGPRVFRCGDYAGFSRTSWVRQFLTYKCRNCDQRHYFFAVAYFVDQLPNGQAMKYGQLPTFGPQIPARLLRLVQPDKDLFLQGSRAERRGFGIGAFAYYRRVVENQRNLIIGKIAKAVEVVGSTPAIDKLFEDAMKQFQFSKSIEMLKDVIPQALLINGENPLILLHSALSKGLHDPEMTDQHCLELAQSIRVVLTELAERIATVSKDDKELVDAIKLLKSIPRSTKMTVERAAIDAHPNESAPREGDKTNA